MVIPVGTGYYQILHKVVRDKDRFIITKYGGCTFVPLVSP